MKIQVFKNEDYQEVSNLPSKGTERATGYDVVATSEPEIVGEKNENGTYKRIDYIQYKTNLKVAVQKEEKTTTGFSVELIDYDILAFPRSSVSKYNLQLANSVGLIDADYRGELLLRFNYLWQPQDYSVYTYESGDAVKGELYTYIGGKINTDKIYKKGDKICQLKVTKVENVNFQLVNELDSTDRGEGGFGSTDVNKVTKIEETKNVVSNIQKLYANLSNKVQSPTKTYSELINEREKSVDFSDPGVPIKKYTELVDEAYKNFNAGEPIKKYTQFIDESKNLNIKKQPIEGNQNQ
jgi:dUTPase